MPFAEHNPNNLKFAAKDDMDGVVFGVYHPDETRYGLLGNFFGLVKVMWEGGIRPYTNIPNDLGLKVDNKGRLLLSDQWRY